MSTEELAEKLNEEGLEASALHGDMKQRQRDRTLRYLRSGKIRFLVATDVAARGIDVASITHVINFDLPKQVEDYVHRIGRTGRAGAEGEAHSFASKRDRGVVQEIEKIMNKSYDIFLGDKGGSKEKRDRSFSRGDDRPKFSRERKSEFGDRERRPFGERKEFGEKKPFFKEDKFKDAGFKMIGKAKKNKSFSFGKHDLEMPSRGNKPSRPTGPKRGKKVFTSSKKSRY